MKLPSDLSAVGIVIDAEHRDNAHKILGRMPNAQGVALLAAWSQATKEFPFVVLAGHLSNKRGGVVGGMAKNWDDALRLVEMAVMRLNEEGEKSVHGFSSAWFLQLTEGREAEVGAVIAKLSPTVGRA